MSDCIYTFIHNYPNLFSLWINHLELFPQDYEKYKELELPLRDFTFKEIETIYIISQLLQLEK